MDAVNLWESQIGKKYQYVNTIEEVLELIRDDKITSEVEIKSKYTPGSKTSGRLDEAANEQNVEITYVDEEHLVAYSDNPFLDSYIHPSFFEQYKEQLTPMFQEKILSSQYSAWIPKIFFSEELFDSLIEKDIKLNFIDFDLTSEQIKRLRDNYIEAYIHLDDKKEQISDNRVIGTYTKKDLKRLDSLYIDVDLNDKEIENFRLLNNGCTVSFGSSFEKLDLDGYKKAKSIIEKVNGIDNNIKFKFNVDRRSKVEQSGLLDLDGANIVFVNDLHEYSFDEYKMEEQKLNNLVKDIKESNMSPFERYIAVYNIVKNYKPYKESDKKDEARSIRYILDNEYMVCVGYAKLFIELLDKVGISAIDYHTAVDISYKDGFTLEEKVIELADHRRVMVNLDDDKYNIHGIYISDPTWDNNLEEDYYNHMIMTFDSMQVSNLRFCLNDEDLIFDAKDFPDFVEKTNALIKRAARRSYKEKPMEKIMYAYDYVYNTIISTFSCLDDNVAKCKMTNYRGVPLEERNEDFFVSFLTDIGHYIVDRTNNKIPNETLVKAISAVISSNNQYAIEEQYKERQDKYFPYQEVFEAKEQIEPRKK